MTEETLEKQIKEIRAHLGLDNPEGMPVGNGAMVMRPDQLPDRNQQQMLRMQQMAIARQTPPMSMAEAREKWKDGKLAIVHFPQRFTISDSETMFQVICEVGWDKVPNRFLAQLRGRCEIVPEEMLT